MVVLKALGVDKYITRKNVFLFILTVLLLGLATNSLFELYKLLPSVFFADHPVLDWENLLLYFIPIFVFILWIIYYYKKYEQLTSDISITPVASQVMPHKGLVFSLSAPQNITKDNICSLIKETRQEQIESLYNIWSIGQLFKGIYHHREELRYIWPLTTERSKDFVICIDDFIKKFIPRAKNNWYEQENICHLMKEDDFELIEELKSKLTKIFIKGNLEQYDLNKTDIIVDISGGTKPITIGTTFGAIDSSIDIQYVEQKTYNIIPLNITPEIMLDKMGEYLIELHLKNKKEKKPLNVDAK
jgi:hypothetical protein